MMFDDRTEEGRIVLALIDERDRLRSRVAKLEAVASAAAAWDRRICWEHTDPDDEERELHEAVATLDERGDPDA